MSFTSPPVVPRPATSEPPRRPRRSPRWSTRRWSGSRPWLNAHSITVLRISLGLVFLVFASFKFVPGLSPAEDLAVATIEKLTFGMVTGSARPCC